MSAAFVYLWDPAAGAWVKAACDADGKLTAVIDGPVTVAQATPENLKAVVYGWDPGTGTYIPMLVNAAGKLIIDPSEILEDTPTDGQVGKAPTSNWAHDHADLPNVHHVAFVAADHTAIGNGAPHHAEAHTLASHTTKAHAELTDIGVSDHHVKYTDAEAKAAAVSNIAYAASWDGVEDVAPSKNAVYDKIQTLGAGTKEIFYPVQLVVSGAGETIAAWLNGWAIKWTAVTHVASLAGYVPLDFTAITSMVVMMVPTNTDATTEFASLLSNYGKVGEALNTHTTTLNNVATECVAGIISEYDVSAAFPSLAAGDYFTLKLTNSANSALDMLGYIYGLRLKYT